MSRETNEGEHSQGQSLRTLFLSCSALFGRISNNENIRSTAEEGRAFLVSGSATTRLNFKSASRTEMKGPYNIPTGGKSTTTYMYAS